EEARQREGEGCGGRRGVPLRELRRPAHERGDERGAPAEEREPRRGRRPAVPQAVLEVARPEELEHEPGGEGERHRPGAACEQREPTGERERQRPEAGGTPRL